MNQLEESTAPATPKNNALSNDVATHIREFLAFKLGDEEYGIDILRVQEIRSYEKPTRMTNTPEFIKGVVNLRGVIVPIIDLRVRFHLDKVTYDGFTVVIILNIGKQVLGIVVDGVSDVITLEPEHLHPVPDFSSSINSENVLAIASVQHRMLILLDIERLMSPQELGLMN